MDTSRWVVITAGNTQQFYIAQTTLSIKDLEQQITLGNAVKFTECRILMHMLGTGMAANGRPEIHTAVNVIPMPMCNQGATIYMCPTMCINPDDNPGMQQIIEALIAESMRTELNIRAKESGLITSASMPSNKRGQ